MTTRRLIKVAKWTMAALTLLSVGVWVLSASPSFWFPLSRPDASGKQLLVSISRGKVAVRWAEPAWINGQWVAIVGKNLNVTLPAWYLPTLTLPLTALLFIIDRRGRIPAGHCRKCGYDLRGAVSDRCSECGTLIAAEPARDAGRHTITERGVSTNKT